MATGTMRMTVSASTANTTSCHWACWRAGTNIAAPTMNHTRSDSTSPATSVNAIVGSSSDRQQAAEGHPGDEGGDEPVRSHLDRAGVGEERQRQRRQRAERRCAEAASDRGPQEQRSTDTDGDPHAGAAEQVEDGGGDAVAPCDGLRRRRHRPRRCRRRAWRSRRSGRSPRSAPVGSGPAPACPARSAAPSAASVGATAAAITAATQSPVPR